jgi:hypothetical protein
VQWSGTVCDRTSYGFPNTNFGFQVYREKDGSVHSVRFHTGAGGRCGLVFPRFIGGARIGEPSKTWLFTRPDGSVVGNATFALEGKNGGENIGRFSINTVKLPKYPHWSFYRFSVVPVSVDETQSKKKELGQLAGFYMGVHMQPQPLGKIPRTMYMVWSGGSARAGDEVPWNKEKPDFNALAFYARGQNEEDASDFLMFDPAQIAAIGMQRWGRTDSVAVLSFITEPDANDCTFAVGSVKGENGEHVVVPRFMTQERENIFNTLRTMEWDAKVDLEGLKNKLKEAAELLKEFPDDEVQKRFDTLSAEFKSLTPDDTAAAAKMENQLKQLLDDIAEKAMESY